MTYFALDMHAAGVEVRPLRQITGEAEFNEVYMTDARVPDAHRIGDVGEGWRASLTTLMNERNAIGTGERRRQRRRSGARRCRQRCGRHLEDAGPRPSRRAPARTR